MESSPFRRPGESVRAGLHIRSLKKQEPSVSLELVLVWHDIIHERSEEQFSLDWRSWEVNALQREAELHENPNMLSDDAILAFTEYLEARAALKTQWILQFVEMISDFIEYLMDWRSEDQPELLGRVVALREQVRRLV